MRYRIPTKVVALEEKTHIARMRNTGENDYSGKPIYEAERETLGWFITFEGSRESLFLSMDKPEAKVGQPATIIVEL